MPQMPPHSITNLAAVTQDDVTRDHDGLAGPTSPSLVGVPTVTDYDITARLGEGGMGVVWRAVQRSTRREVALKLLSPATIGSDRARVRFEREVELSARLEHPHIARVYDAGVCDGIPYYAMQLVDGVPLDNYVRDHKPDRRQLLALMREVCEAVQHAHQRGIIHRDLKPSNILVDSAGKPTVLDFGLAKATAMDEDLPTLSLDGQVAGTPAYMSPEQAAGKTEAIDTRSDVYTLGVILYRLLTGSTPHDLTGSTMDVLRRIAEQEARKPRLASREASRIIDSELETLLMKCLAHDPDRRYASAGALAADLDNYLNNRPLSAKQPTTMYVIGKQLRRHHKAVAAAGLMLALFTVATSAATIWLYNRPVDLRVDSTPGGAHLKIDGELKLGCGVTPCHAVLGPGKHTIELVLSGHYQPQVRHVEVRWGRITGDAYEPIVLSPNFRSVFFTTDPPKARAEIRKEGNGELVTTIQTPGLITLPHGRYTMHFGLLEGELDMVGKPLAIAGDTKPLQVHHSIASASSD